MAENTLTHTHSHTHCNDEEEEFAISSSTPGNARMKIMAILGITYTLLLHFAVVWAYAPLHVNASSGLSSEYIHKFLDTFSASNTNANLHPELQVIGAGLLPGQVLEIMKYSKGMPITHAVFVEGFQNVANHMNSTDSAMQHLRGLLNRYHSDKADAYHGYHAFYAGMLQNMVDATMEPIATLEVGLGTNTTTAVGNMGISAKPGASNRAFRDFLPTTGHVYGADVDRSVLYYEKGIDTAWVDQLNISSFDQMTQSLGQRTFTLIVDDGLHALQANLNTLIFGLKHVRLNGWMVIEDISEREPQKTKQFWMNFVDVILRSNPTLRTKMVKPGAGGPYCYLVQKIA